MIYFCCTNKRRDAVGASNLNGIDFLEVFDDPTLPNSVRQRKLFIHFLKPLTKFPLVKKNLKVDGGERIRNIQIVGISASAEILTVDVDEPGDFSIYTLRLLQDATSGDPNEPPPKDFDPLFSVIKFSFKVQCPNDFDCAATSTCPPATRTEPELDYLAKDYNSFRQLMLDRIALLMPKWTERNPADLGIVLVELLAYIGDHLSYRQDAIATEAYLGTALQRVSARRHARLVDYGMHDGCNARTWIHLETDSGGPVFIPNKTQLFTRLPNQPIVIQIASQTYDRALAKNPEVFETMDDITIFSAHNQIEFYTWGATECCLPKHATQATLRDDINNRLRLSVGDVLIFEERKGPKSGDPADADPAHRHAVRLTKVTNSVAGLSDPLYPNELIVEIEWAADDELPFPLCISSTTDKEHHLQKVPDVSVAMGNNVLADHGMTVSDESLGAVPAPNLFLPATSNGNRCDSKPQVPITPRYRPTLQKRPLTQIGRVTKKQVIGIDVENILVPFDPDTSARSAFKWKMADVLPKIQLAGTYDKDVQEWKPQRDLLSSHADAKEFVVEIENDARARLRFGDDIHGLRPDSETTFVATYRVGNGTSGNVGADSIAHIALGAGNISITLVRNPLSARGGIEPETIEDVRQRAPYAFRTQERAVTAKDYALMAQRNTSVQRAVGTFCWTGSWRTMFVSIDRLGGAPVDNAFKQEIEDELEAYRMAGQDLDVDDPKYLSLEIEMQVCVKPDYFRTDVKQALLEIFSNRVLADGRPGVFNPDKFTFGQTVFLSPLYSAAQAVDGVGSVVISRFQRQGKNSDAALQSGKLELARLEIARCDNDPNFPEHGVFKLTVDGGK